MCLFNLFSPSSLVQLCLLLSPIPIETNVKRHPNSGLGTVNPIMKRRGHFMPRILLNQELQIASYKLSNSLASWALEVRFIKELSIREHKEDNYCEYTPESLLDRR